MKKLTFVFMVCTLMGLRCPQAASEAERESGFQLTIELRDGSRVVGNTLEDTLSLHSAALGDLKLAWAGIRAIEYVADTGAARLTATNGDTFTVQLAGDTLDVETGFGKTELPVKLIRSIRVAPTRPIAAATAAGESGWRLKIELRDGSHVVGKGLDESLAFHSPGIGDLKLAWSGIRSIEYATTNTDLARLTATNGDVLGVQPAFSELKVKASFGKVGLPMKMIRSIQVSAMTPAATGVPIFNIDFGVWKPNPSPQTGPAAAGFEGDFWNAVAVPWNNDHTESGLKFADGQPSPIQVEMVNLGGGWHNDGRMGVKAPMLNTFNYPMNNQGGNSSVILKQVPPGRYDLYLYGHKPEPLYYGDYTVTVGDRSYGRKTTFHEGDTGQKTEWEEGWQYVKFAGVTVAADDDIDILIRPGGELAVPAYSATHVNVSRFGGFSETFSGPTGPGVMSGGTGRRFADAMICGLQLVPVN